jgi:hypothetical protein
VWKQDQGLLECQKSERHQNKMVAHLQRVCHTLTLPFTLLKKKNLRQKKSYGNSNISPCKKNIIFQKNLEKKPKYFKILELEYN